MSNSITDFLAAILSAKYGEQVRGAIHDAIELCYQDGKAGVNDLEARHLIEQVIGVNEMQDAGIETLTARVEALEQGGEGESAGTTTTTVPTFIVDHGVANFSNVQANKTATMNVTFAKTFTEAPVVAAIKVFRNGPNTFYSLVTAQPVESSITSTGFTLAVGNKYTQAVSPSVLWIAFQPTEIEINTEIIVPSGDGMTEAEVRELLAPISAALNGIKTGYDGTVYDTPGEAVREQINDLHVLIGDVPGQAIDASAVAYNDSDVGTELTNVNGRLQELKEFNAVQFIPNHADVQSKTELGLTWSCTNGVFTINGTTTSSWYENIFNSPDSIPEWFSEGNKLFIKLNKSGSDTRFIYFRISVYKQDDTTELIVDTYKDTVFTVPNIDDVVGVRARVFVAQNNTVSGVIHPVVLSAPSNLELSDVIDSTNASVATMQNMLESTDAKDTIDLVPRLSNGDTVKNGVTFSYLNGTTTINGTATSATYFKLCGDTNSLPDGVIAGRRYFIDIAHRGGTVARVKVECKVDGATSFIFDDDKSMPLLIPLGTTGLAIYIYVYTTGVVENERMTVSLRRALTNYALSNSILPPNPGAMMTIIDDDGALGFYTQLLPIIKAKHIPIASAVIGSKIGKSSAYMTWEQIEECFAEGAEILNHTYMHYGETDENRPTNEIRMDYTKNANLMWSHNIPTGDILVYPGGSGNMTTAQLAAKRFASAAFRANGNKLNLINQIDPFYIDRYRIESDYSYDIDQMKGLIDNCIAKGGWMVWMIHTSSGYNWNENALSAVSQAIDYAISSGLPIVTARYGIERYIKKRLY